MTKTTAQRWAAKASAVQLAETRRRMLNDTTKLIWNAEYAFCEGRKWRFDFACPDIATAIEIDGGVWSGGRHGRGAGMLADMEKLNTAQLFGWIVLRYSPKQFAAGDWIPDIEAAKRRTRVA